MRSLQRDGTEISPEAEGMLLAPQATQSYIENILYWLYVLAKLQSQGQNATKDALIR